MEIMMNKTRVHTNRAKSGKMTERGINKYK